MYKYLYFAKIQTALILSQRFDLFTDWIGVAVRYLVLLGLWSLTTTDNTDEFKRLVLYFALTNIIRNILTSRTAGHLRKAIFSGDLNNTLVKPINFIAVAVLQTTTRVLVKFITPTLIFILAAIIAPDYFAPQSIMSLVLFGVFVVLALVVWNLLMVIIGLSTFWISENRGLITVIDLIFGFLMGGFMPAYFFSEQMQNVLKLTPIHYLAAFPVDVYSGKVPLPELVSAIGVIILWSMLLLYIINLLRSSGLRHYDANGA
jgi:ABC-type uncharacterized transport system permease subunit